MQLLKQLFISTSTGPTKSKCGGTPVTSRHVRNFPPRVNEPAAQASAQTSCGMTLSNAHMQRLYSCRHPGLTHSWPNCDFKY